MKVPAWVWVHPSPICSTILPSWLYPFCYVHFANYLIYIVKLSSPRCQVARQSFGLTKCALYYPCFQIFMVCPLFDIFFFHSLTLYLDFKALPKSLGLPTILKLFPWLLNLEKNPKFSSFFLFLGVVLMAFLSLKGNISN